MLQPNIICKVFKQRFWAMILVENKGKFKVGIESSVYSFNYSIIYIPNKIFLGLNKIYSDCLNILAMWIIYYSICSRAELYILACRLQRLQKHLFAEAVIILSCSSINLCLHLQLLENRITYVSFLTGYLK